MGPGGQSENPTCSHADVGPFVSENDIILSKFADSHVTIDSDETEHEPHVVPTDPKDIPWNHYTVKARK